MDVTRTDNHDADCRHSHIYDMLLREPCLWLLPRRLIDFRHNKIKYSRIVRFPFSDVPVLSRRKAINPRYSVVWATRWKQWINLNRLFTDFCLFRYSALHPLSPSCTDEPWLQALQPLISSFISHRYLLYPVFSNLEPPKVISFLLSSRSP